MSRLIAKSTAGRSLASSALVALAALAAAGCRPPPAPIAADPTASTPLAAAAALAPLSTAVPPTAPPPTPLSVSHTAVAPAPTVESPPVTTDWYFADPPDWCAEAPAIHSEAAAQRFERGQLIWVAATDELFIFIDGNGFSRIKPLRPLPGSNEDHRVGGAPSGLYEPVRGFGLAWRDELEGVTGLREQLGWAIEPEQAFTTDYQCAMPTSTTVFLDCYLRGPRSVIRISERHVAGTSWEELPER